MWRDSRDGCLHNKPSAGPKSLSSPIYYLGEVGELGRVELPDHEGVGLLARALHEAAHRVHHAQVAAHAERAHHDACGGVWLMLGWGGWW